MKQLVHGGDWMGYRERFGRDALDFSANVSPLGLPEGVAQAIRDALPLADRYPDPLCRTLRAALSRAEGVPQERILCGNGAADLIFRLVWAVKPHKALVTAPTFAEYASALDTVECEVKRFFLDETNDFAPDGRPRGRRGREHRHGVPLPAEQSDGAAGLTRAGEKAAAPVRGVPHDFGRR